MSAKVNPVERVHLWGNALLARSAVVTETEVRDMWTEDGSMIVNGQLKCSGITALARHFEELRTKLKSAHVQLPYAMSIESESAIAARYVIDIEHINGTRDKIHVGAFFGIRDGKIQTMDEVVWFENTEIALEKH
jgi:hypothetical protein